MALTPERIAELERLKEMMRQPAADAQRKAQAIFNAEKGAGQPVKLPTDKAKGGQISQDAMQLAIMPKVQQYARPVTHAHHLEIEERPL